MPSLKEYNEFGQLVCTVEGLLAPVQLTSVATTSGSSTVTVNSTTNLFPGMVFRCPNFSGPCIIHAIRSTTTIDLVASVFSATGVWTTSAANAQATATASNLQATALAFDPAAIVSSAYAMGMWRNTHRLTNSAFYNFGISGTAQTGQTMGTGIIAVPVTTTNPAASAPNSGFTLPVTTRSHFTDELQDTPLKRHNGEFWSFYFAVSTGGQLSKIPAIPTNRLVYAA